VGFGAVPAVETAPDDARVDLVSPSQVPSLGPVGVGGCGQGDVVRGLDDQVAETLRRQHGMGRTVGQMVRGRGKNRLGLVWVVSVETDQGV
jgi:hypothetical protein